MKQLIKKLFFKKISVFGDSHSAIFTYINSLYISNSRFDVTTVGGATAFGLANPNSKTNALEVFEKKLQSTKKTDQVVFLLGEVDTGYLIWWRSMKNNTHHMVEFEQSLSNYQNFLLQQKERGFKNVIVLSATLPTIKNNYKEHGEIAGQRNAITVSQQDRTKLTLAYNCSMKDFCDENKMTFIDLDGKMLDQETQLINDVFLNKDPLNHHCDDKRYSAVIINEFKKRKLIKWIISKPRLLQGSSGIS